MILQELERTGLRVDELRATLKKAIEFWRRTEKGRQEMKVSFLIMSFRKVGQLGCVKFWPSPPSNALGNVESEG